MKITKYNLNCKKVSGYLENNNNNIILDFQKELGDFISTKKVYVVPVSSCTHALELLFTLNLYSVNKTDIYRDVEIPDYTYLSVYKTLKSISSGLKINKSITYNYWKNYYQIKNTNIFDSARCLKRNLMDEIKLGCSNPLVCLSFGYSKPLDIGKGGAIVFFKNKENKELYHILKRMSHDGRDSALKIHDDKLLRDEFNVDIIGKHYNFSTKQAEEALLKLNIIKQINKQEFGGYENYNSLSSYILDGE